MPWHQLEWGPKYLWDYLPRNGRVPYLDFFILTNQVLNVRNMCAWANYQVILSDAIPKLKPDFFWLGGGEVDLKLGLRTDDFIKLVKPWIINCTWLVENFKIPLCQIEWPWMWVDVRGGWPEILVAEKAMKWWFDCWKYRATRAIVGFFCPLDGVLDICLVLTNAI